MCRERPHRPHVPRPDDAGRGRLSGPQGAAGGRSNASDDRRVRRRATARAAARAAARGHGLREEEPQPIRPGLRAPRGGAPVTAPLLAEDKRDALQEIVNIGMGAAGAALAQVLGAFVELSVPRIDLVDRRRAATLFNTGSWSDNEIEVVRQPFFGGISGESLMLFDGAEPEHLADLVGYATTPSKEEQQEMLLDLANVVIGSCVNGIVEPLAEVVSFAPPSRLGGRPDAHAFVLEDVGHWQQ